jgi:N-methylhydantoinase A
VLIPQQAGAFCAFGMTVTDVRHDLLRVMFAGSKDVVPSEIDGIFRELEETGIARLRAEGFSDDEIVLERSVDVRYVGQVHELTIPIPRADTYSLDEIGTMSDIFHIYHEQQFAFARPDVPIEFLHWRVSATGRLPTDQKRGSPVSSGGAEPTADRALTGTRLAYSAERDELVPTPVFAAEKLEPGACVRDQSIIQAPTTTIVLNDGDALTVLPNRSYSVLIGTSRS